MELPQTFAVELKDGSWFMLLDIVDDKFLFVELRSDAKIEKQVWVRYTKSKKK